MIQKKVCAHMYGMFSNVYRRNQRMSGNCRFIKKNKFTIGGLGLWDRSGRCLAII